MKFALSIKIFWMRDDKVKVIHHVSIRLTHKRNYRTVRFGPCGVRVRHFFFGGGTSIRTRSHPASGRPNKK